MNDHDPMARRVIASGFALLILFCLVVLTTLCVSVGGGLVAAVALFYVARGLTDFIERTLLGGGCVCGRQQVEQQGGAEPALSPGETQ